MAIVEYGIGVLPLNKHPKVAYPDATQLWYAHDASAMGNFANMDLCFNSLERNGPARGY